jgi:hypothetical protein
VAYFAEWNFYVGNQALTPGHAGALAGTKVKWIDSTRFSMIGFAPEGAVFYDYGLFPAIDFPTKTNGLTIHAQGDLDANGDKATFFVNDNTNEIMKSGGTF